MLDFPHCPTWFVDFECNAPDGERPDPASMAALELRTGQEICLWREQMGCTPPIDTSKNSLVVGFAVDTELGCFNALGWRAPVNVLDLRIEWLHAVNFTPRLALSKKERKNWSSLLHVMSHYGLDAMDALEKQRMRDLITRGEPFTDAERKEIENYNLSDVRAYRRLFLVMVQRGHIPRNYRRFLQCLFRGRCMCSMARMEWTGVPINTERHSRLVDAFESGRLKKNLIETLGKRYGVFDEKGSFREKRFIRLLNAWGIGWPLLPSGRLDLKDRTFKMMAQIHPELEDLRQLLYCLEKLKLRSLIVGSDGYARCWLNPCGSRTGRYQPSNAEFIFGPAVWMRAYLIQAKPGWVIIYLDYEGQEFGIAAALSGDPAMLEAYNSGDIYIAFGKQAGLLPAWATKETHRQQRDQLKVCVLATQYGQEYRSLAEKLDQPDIVARELLQKHRKTYSVFWSWLENRVNRAMLTNEQETVFGWKHRFRERPKPNTVKNFFMQGNGSEMLKLACCLGTEGGISICAPVHDAILMQAPIDHWEEDVARMRAYMAEASRIVLNGFVLRTEQHVFPHPEHYSDPQGRGRLMLETVMKLL
jgi:DNA polymerase-1